MLDATQNKHKLNKYFSVPNTLFLGIFIFSNVYSRFLTTITCEISVLEDSICMCYLKFSYQKHREQNINLKQGASYKLFGNKLFSSIYSLMLTNL